MIKRWGAWLNVIEDIAAHTENLDFKLEIGDVLVIYTDGIIESTNGSDQMLEMQGLMDLVIQHGEK